MNIRSSFRKDRLLYLMMIPGLAWFILFRYVPMYGVSIAFRDYNIFQGFSNAPFVGLAVFQKLFGYPDFFMAFRNTIILSILKLVCGFPIPILLSLMINEIRGSKAKKFVQTAVILPNFFSWVILGNIIYMIFSPGSGAIRSLLSLFGYKGIIPDLLTNRDTFRMVLVWTDVWKSAGYGTIVYLGVITGIDSQLYEAAEIDGAGWLRRIWHITLAGLRPTIVILFLFRMGGLMHVGFEQIFILGNPLVRPVSEVLETYVYRIGMNSRQYSIGTAAGLINSGIGLCLVFLTNKLANRLEPGSGIM